MDQSDFSYLNDRVKPGHWMLFTICFLGMAFGGTVSTLMSVYLPVAVNDLLGERSVEEFNRISAYINAIFIFGGAFGGLCAGWLADRAGRKTAVIVSIACYAIFTILTGFMPDWWGVVVCRFFTGWGLGAVLVTATTMMMEEWPRRTRAIFLGILSISVPVGIFSAGVIDYFVSSWRQAFLVGIIPLVIALISIKALVESKTWKSHQESLHNVSGRSGVFHPLYRGDLMKGSAIFGTMLIGLWAVFSWLPTWVHTLVTTGDGQEERGLSMMMLGIGGLLGGFISGWVINALGPRKSMLLCFGVSLIGSWLLFKTNDHITPIVYAEILLLAIFFGISQGVLSVYVPALFPVQVRGTATGFCFNIGRFFTAAGVLFVGVLVTELGGYANSLFVFSMIFLAGFVVTWFSPDRTAIEEDDKVMSSTVLNAEMIK